MGDVAEWMRESVEAFGERADTLALAYLHKHGKRGLVVFDDRRHVGLCIAYIEPMPPAVEPIVEPLTEEAIAQAPDAWQRWIGWTGGLEPENAAIVMVAEPSGVRVFFRERTPQLDQELKTKAAIVGGMLEEHSKNRRERMH